MIVQNVTLVVNYSFFFLTNAAFCLILEEKMLADVRNMDWDNLLSGLIGGIIGGLASIAGAMISTKSNINSQKKASEEQEKQNVSLSANILLLDIEGLLKEMVHLARTKPISTYGLGSHSSNYSDHIAILGSRLNHDEQYALNHLYGIIMKYQQIAMMNTSNLSDSTVVEMYLQKLLSHFCNTVY